MDYVALSIFIGYFIVLLLIGYMAYRKTKDFSSYILGGRNIGPVVGGISTGASDMSGFLMLGLPGALYAGGISAIWLPVGLAIGAYLNWHYVGKRIRVFTQVAKDSETVPEFLENRFRDNSSAIKIISSLFILIFFAFYISSGLVGGALLFEETFGVSYSTGLLIIAMIILVYTSIGGFFAVTWTDFFQGLLMFLALIIVPAVTFHYVGGWDEMVKSVGAISISNLDVFSGTTALGIISLLGWGLGYFGQPHTMTRFMAMKSKKDITIAKSVYTIWNVSGLYGAIFVGITGMAYFANAPLDNPETVFIQLSEVLFSPVITGFLLVALLAAIMSTISSQLLISATALAEDLYKGILRKKASERELLWVIRLGVILISLFAVVLAINPQSSILNLVGYAWAGFGSVFGPAILLSLFWKGTTRNGVLAGMIVGGLTVIIWSFLSKPPVGPNGVPLSQSEAVIPFYLYELIPGFVLAMLAILVFSKIGSTPTKEMEAEFDLVNANIK